MIFVLACCCIRAGNASTVLFDDLGTGSDAFDEHAGFTVSGTGASGGAFTSAHEFTVSGNGDYFISEMDIAMMAFGSTDTFTASIWSDVNGNPGVQLDGAFWGASAPANPGGVVAISDITNVTVIGEQNYFLVLGPLSPSDDSSNVFPVNNQGALGDYQFSRDGGLTWTDAGVFSQGAFAILGDPVTATPEPAAVTTLLAFIVGLLAVYRNSRLSFRSASSRRDR